MYDRRGIHMTPQTKMMAKKEMLFELIELDNTEKMNETYFGPHAIQLETIHNAKGLLKGPIPIKEQTHSIIDHQVNNLFKNKKIPSLTKTIIYHNWVFTAPFSHDWSDVLIQVAYIFIFQELCLQKDLRDRVHYDKLRHTLYRYTNYHLLTVIDKVIPWTERYWKKQGRNFSPIIVENKRYHLTQNNELEQSPSYFKVQILLSREQRHIISPDLIIGPTYGFFTPLTNEGAFSNFICDIIHHSTTHLCSTQIHECMLLNRGFWVSNPHKVFSAIKRNCTICRIKEATSCNDRYLAKRYRKSGSLDIGTFLDRPGYCLNSRYSIMDLTGPFFIRLSGSKHKVWICLYLDLRSHVLTISPVYSLSSESIVCNVNAYCMGLSGTIFISDSGSNFSGAHRDINVKNLEVTKDVPLLSTEQLLMSQISLDEQQISFLLVPAKYHVAIGRVEFMVGKMKRIFSETGIYTQLREGIYNIDQFSYILKKCAYIINTRPLMIAKEGSMITPLTIHAMSQSNPFLLEQNVQIPNGLLNIVNQINRAIFIKIFRQNILELQQNLHKRIGTSLSSTIKIGDVVFDPYSFEKSRNYARSIFLVSYINKSQTWLLLTKPRSQIALRSRYAKSDNVTPKLEINLKDDQQYLSCHKNKILISRSIGQIYLIAHQILGASITFEKPFLGDLLTGDNGNLIEQHLRGKNHVYLPENLNDALIPPPDMNMDLFKHLKLHKHPTLEVPDHFQTLDTLDDTNASKLLKSLFESETLNDKSPVDIGGANYDDDTEDVNLRVDDEFYSSSSDDEEELVQETESLERILGKRTRRPPDRYNPS